MVPHPLTRGSTSGSSQRQQRPLVLEEPALPVQTAAESCELAPGADDAVAGHDDGNGVLAVGGADGAGQADVAEAARDLAVAARDAERDRAKLLPHAQLEGGAGWVQRQIERGAGAGEVFGELLPYAREDLTPWCLSPWPPLPFVERGNEMRGRKIHARERGLGRREDELAEGAGDADDGDGHPYRPTCRRV